ncbi:hypothetical protein Sjap_026212 [Stephania japonica]|uniref:Uncharacterized protein n=1 Tax=Stephania japonica TaxID=461633 RepID=A0AAP0HIN6_9MAGN
MRCADSRGFRSFGVSGTRHYTWAAHVTWITGLSASINDLNTPSTAPQFEEKSGELVEDKVDWKGRVARRDKHGGIQTSLLILGAFCFENMASFALAINLVTYFNGIMHLNIADAANTLTNFMGISYILTLAVAFLGDSYIGKYKAVVISGIIEFAGLALLAIQAHEPKLRPPTCNVFDPKSHCKKAEGGDSAFLYVGLYLIAAGTAGIKSCLPAHGADQFDEKDPGEAKQMSSFFNWLLLAVCLGGAVSLTLIVWIQDNKGWDWGFAICAVAMFLAVVVFLSGLPRYRIQEPRGRNALAEIIQVYVAAFHNRNLRLPENPEELYEIEKDKEAAVEEEFLAHRDTLRFLDKAAILPTPVPPQFGESKLPTSSPWKLCRVTKVENAKIILNMAPIVCCTVIMSTCLAQLQTFSIQQGITMDTSLTRSFNIPPASLPILPVMFMIIVIPIYDRLIVPLARRFTGHPTGITHLQRIGVGLVLSSLSMASAAIVEAKRKGVARSNGMLDALPVFQPLPVSAFLLSFQYFIFGIADMFTYVGLLEFFYSEAPKGLKALSTCFLWSSMAIGYFLSTIIVQLVNLVTKGRTSSGGWLAGNNINRNHLNLFYWLLSILSLLNFVNYLFWAKRYKYRSQPLDDM